MKKNFMNASLSILMILFFCQQIQARTIYSTVAGGKWNTETSWIGSVIPGENDTAILQGPIIIGHVEGYNKYDSYGGWVIIEESGSIEAHEYGGGLGTFTLFVAHDIVNYGLINNGPEYLHLEINGHITNNGVWKPHKTILNGAENQNIMLGDGWELGGYWQISNSGSITALSDIRYSGKYVFEGIQTGIFDLGGSILHMNNFSINTTGSIIYNGTIEGDFSIEGRFLVSHTSADTLFFMGNVSVTDTLQNNEYGGGLGIMCLYIDGNLINNGVIRDDDDTKNDDRLNILITGDITNNGKWSCYYVKFTGSDEQHITQAEGMFFDSFFEDLNGESPISTETDITITNDFELGGTTLEMLNGMLTVGGWLKNGNIDNCLLKDAYIQNVTSLDNLEIHGKVTCDEGNVFLNHVRIIDTLQSNEYGGGSKYYDLEVNGYFINDGVVQNNNPGDRLRLHLSSDFENNGIWLNEETILTGSEGQQIQLGDGFQFGGTFVNLDSTNILSAYNNDLSFTGDFNLGKSVLMMDGQKLHMGGWLHNGSLDKAELYGGFLQNLDCTNDISIYERVTVDENVSFQGLVTVNDTLIPNLYGGGAKRYYLDIDGDLINHGVIMDNYSGEMLQMYITGNLTNNGDWINHLTHVYVSNEQYIELIDDKPIEGTMEFDAVIQSETYQWYYDDNILDSEDFEGETSQVLKWLVPVSSDYYGSFYCETGTKETIGILVKKGTTGIHENNDLLCQAKIWSSGNCLTIDLHESSNGTAEVFDLSGRKVDQFNINQGMNKAYFNLNGCYIVRIQSGQKYASQKVMLK